MTQQFEQRPDASAIMAQLQKLDKVERQLWDLVENQHIQLGDRVAALRGISEVAFFEARIIRLALEAEESQE